MRAGGDGEGAFIVFSLLCVSLSQTLFVRATFKAPGGAGAFFSQCFLFFIFMNVPVNQDKLITRREFADFLGVSLPTVEQYVKDGCPIVSLTRKVTGKGSRYRFEKEVALQWLRNRTRAKRR